MPLGLRSEVPHEEDHDHGPGGGHERDGGSQRARRSVLVAVVDERDPPEKQEIVKERDEGAEGESTDPCDDPEQHGEERKRKSPDGLRSARREADGTAPERVNLWRSGRAFDWRNGHHRSGLSA